MFKFRAYLPPTRPDLQFIYIPVDFTSLPPPPPPIMQLSDVRPSVAEPVGLFRVEPEQTKTGQGNERRMTKTGEGHRQGEEKDRGRTKTEDRTKTEERSKTGGGQRQGQDKDGKGKRQDNEMTTTMKG